MWHRRPSSVVHLLVHPYINSGFSETTSWIQANFYGKLPIHHISSLLLFVSVFLFSNMYNFCFAFSLTLNPMGAKISKCYLSQGFSLISFINTINMLVVVEYRWSAPKYKFYGTWKFFLTHGLEISKFYFYYSFH